MSLSTSERISARALQGAIARDFEEARRIDALFPVDINGEARS